MVRTVLVPALMPLGAMKRIENTQEKFWVVMPGQTRSFSVKASAPARVTTYDVYKCYLNNNTSSMSHCINCRITRWYGLKISQGTDMIGFDCKKFEIIGTIIITDFFYIFHCSKREDQSRGSSPRTGIGGRAPCRNQSMTPWKVTISGCRRSLKDENRRVLFQSWKFLLDS